MQEAVIIQGDAFQIMPQMAANSVDVTVTDIPYNEVNRKSAGLRSLDKGEADSAPVDIEELVKQLVRITKHTLYIWCGMEQVSPLRAALREAGLTTRVGVWEKTNPSPMNGDKLWLSGIELCVFARKPKAPFYRHCKNPVWRGPTKHNPDFPCPKPVWLMQELITASTPEGGVVFDPFLGSGTTVEAALTNGYSAIGIEQKPEYYALSWERVSGLIVPGKSQIRNTL